MTRSIVELDGKKFSDFAGFVAEFNRGFVSKLYPDAPRWDGDLDYLDELLELPPGEEPYVIRWRNSSKSRTDLDHAVMADHWRGWLTQCHPVMREGFESRFDEANRGVGMTMFDWLVHNFRQPDENGNYVELLLE